MPGVPMPVPNVRSPIAVLSGLLLVLSVVRIALEFRSAQYSVDHLAHSTHSVPSLPHPSHHPSSPSPPDLGTPLSSLSPRPFLSWTVSTEQRRSRGARADVRINNDNSRYLRHIQPGRGPARGVAAPPVAVLLSGAVKKAPVLVIVVCSKPEHTELRLAIRRSWGLEADGSKVMVRFFVGQTEGWEKIITREQDLHGDVIRTEYLDTYENLSYKVLAAISWALNNVRSAQYVMKIDDDTYVNLPYLLSELRDGSVIRDSKRAYVMGAVCVNSSVVRDDGDKWFVSRLDYPSDVYPTYVFGGGYVMTKAAAEGIMAASVKVDYLHLEDVFVTGILGRLAGVHHLPHPAFVFWTSRRPSPCDMVTGRRLTAVSLTSKQFYVMYSGIHAILRTGNWTAC